MKDSIELPSPAKLNLFLHINGRREDGYHNLQTVFQLLDYGDNIRLSLRDDDEIQVDPALAGVPTTSNLAYKAADLLRMEFVKTTTSKTQPLGANIHIDKILPMGGGIGGGSSNAASVLLGLNKLWNCGFSIEQLAKFGATLGADVPVFVKGVSAWAEGVGEILTPIKLPTRWYIVLVPPCSVSTAQIFSHKCLTRDTDMITLAAFLKGGGKNDCQQLVEQLYPPVKDAVDWLGQYGSAQLTGTGACVFASFSSESEAQDVFAKRPKQWVGFVAQGVNESPMHQSLQACDSLQAKKDVTGV